jgi:hypothetical protein
MLKLFIQNFKPSSIYKLTHVVMVSLIHSLSWLPVKFLNFDDSAEPYIVHCLSFKGLSIFYLYSEKWCCEADLMLFYAGRLPRCRPDTAPDTAAVSGLHSLIFGSEGLPINTHVFVENLQLFNYVASHWSKPGAICQLEAQKRTDAFIVVFS